MHDKIISIIESKRDRPMSWDGNDCLTGLAIPLARAVSNDDTLFANYTGQFDTLEGAVKAFKSWGFDTLADLLGSELREIPLSECEAGDILAMPFKGTFKYTLGVYDGERCLIYAQHGLVPWDDMEGFRAFTARVVPQCEG